MSLSADDDTPAQTVRPIAPVRSPQPVLASRAHVVLRQGEVAEQAKTLIAGASREADIARAGSATAKQIATAARGRRISGHTHGLLIHLRAG
jgi:hypothetical protein